MAAYQKGDLDAFAVLVSRHQDKLWCFIRRFGADPATAEDLVQEVFLRMVKSAGEWQPAAKVSTWLYTIARNLCTDHARRAVFRKTATLDGGRDGAVTAVASEDSGPRPLGERIAATGRGAEGEVMGREVAARIDAAIAALPPDQREVFLMREVMDLPFAEIARAVGASEPTVKSRMRYALERLRDALDEFRDMAGAAPTARAAEST